MFDFFRFLFGLTETAETLSSRTGVWFSITIVAAGTAGLLFTYAMRWTPAGQIGGIVIGIGTFALVGWLLRGLLREN